VALLLKLFSLEIAEPQAKQSRFPLK